MRYIITTACLVLALAATGQQMSSEAWMKMITANALQPGDKSVHPGYALYYVKARDFDAPYIVYVPKGYDPAHPVPMVVFLHGAILARDNFHHKDPAIADEPIFSIGDVFNTIVVFPFCKNGFSWPQEDACEYVMNVIAQVQRSYSIDKKRIYIGGISMGGLSTWWFVDHRPNDFAGFYTFSAMPRVNEPVQFENITRQRPLYSMNAEDDPVFSYKEVHDLYEQHKQQAPGWKFRTVPSGGHRFIYNPGGTRYVKELLGDLLKR